MAIFRGSSSRLLIGLGLLLTALLIAVSAATAAPARTTASARAPRHGDVAGVRHRQDGERRRHTRIDRTRRSRADRRRAAQQRGRGHRDGDRSRAILTRIAPGSDARRPARATSISAQDAVAEIGTGAEQISATDPSGVPMPTGDLPGWKQIFADDFPTSEDASPFEFSGCRWGSDMNSSECSSLPSADIDRWFAYPDGSCDTTCDGRYEPSQDTTIAGHMMDMDLHTNPLTGTPGVDALAPKVGQADGSGQLYGTFSVRFRTQSAQGYSLSFLLWPDDNVWPKHSEVDFPETDSQLGGSVTAFMHWMGATSSGQQDIYSTPTDTTQWHTYTIEWTPRMVRFMIDGQTIGTSTSHLPTDPMHWVLQANTNLSGILPQVGLSSDIQVAWVTDYAYEG